jgi:hypothetical protein
LVNGFEYKASRGLKSDVSAPGESLGGEDETPFELVLNGRNAKKAEKAAMKKAPGPQKPKPLVLEGASEELKASPLEVKKVLRDYKDNIAKTASTKRGTVLVFPASEWLA